MRSNAGDRWDTNTGHRVTVQSPLASMVERDAA
jgi:hypothetical protein